MSSLRVVNVTPKDEQHKYRGTIEHDDILGSPASTPGPFAQAEPFSSPPSAIEPVSPIASPTPPSVFDAIDEVPEAEEEETDPTTALENSGRDWDEQDDGYNLKPPPVAAAQSNSVEALAVRLFSSDHLDLILREPRLAARFNRFLGQYRPQYTATLRQYVHYRKAVAAIDYANAVTRRCARQNASMLEPAFEARLKQTVGELVEEALSAYLTHRLVSLVTDSLVKEITGNSAPIMQDLIPSLAEVYCITDPSLPDNPIVYASEEFYSTTQYGREYVIGRNCRFLQGPRSSGHTVRRLIEALAKGEEICETILNYRRDGSPFINLLMIAPLYDNEGIVRYFLGCQIDVTSLIDGGRGLESFQQLLIQDRQRERFGGRWDQDPTHALRDLTQLLSEDEAEIVRSATPTTASLVQRPQSSMLSTRPTPERTRSTRIVLGMDGAKQHGLWPSATHGPSGRLPGVYKNYLLVRPFPSLRITFTSASLRIPGILQTKLLDRIDGADMRSALADAFEQATGVTAKVSWNGKPRWLHCTPLFGSDERVGVWMVVMVEEEEVTGTINRGASTASVTSNGGAGRFTASKLYADYLKREGRERPFTQETQQTSSSTREMREAEETFRDF